MHAMAIQFRLNSEHTLLKKAFSNITVVSCGTCTDKTLDRRNLRRKLQCIDQISDDSLGRGRGGGVCIEPFVTRNRRLPDPNHRPKVGRYTEIPESGETKPWKNPRQINSGNDKL
jgi:hypothetical protein